MRKKQNKTAKQLSGNTSIKKVEVRSRAELRNWLKAHCGQKESIWLVTYKKSEPEYYIGYDSIVEEALCFGWIDSLPRALDENRTMLRLSPRNPKSAWSKANRDRVSRLVREGLMTPIGMKLIEEAKRNGSWKKLRAIDQNSIPDDLKDALAKNPKAKKFFDEFPPSSKRAILEWIQLAKTEETRKRRIEETVRSAAKNIRANHYRQPSNTSRSK